MTNHVHFVIKTGAAPLSTVMRRVHTGFAVRFDRRYARSGYLFQGRFGSRLARDEDGLLAVMRYVLRNPLEGGLVADLAALERFAWCGYGALLGRRAPRAFECVPEALALFAADATQARSRMRAWMEQPSEPSESVTGEERLAELVRAVCRDLDVREEDLRAGRRSRPVSRARTHVCRRAVGELGLRPVAVARALRLSESAVSQALGRAEPAVSEDGGPSPS
jgi:hypothetical protein